jgi:hypothetical protein
MGPSALGPGFDKFFHGRQFKNVLSAHLVTELSLAVIFERFPGLSVAVAIVGERRTSEHSQLHRVLFFIVIHVAQDEAREVKVLG